jgi:hypothetical protein
MKRVVLIFILLVLICSSALIGYDWITSQSHLSPPAQNGSVIEVDKSWVENVNNLLEEAKPYPDESGLSWTLAEYSVFLHENGTAQLVTWASPSDALGPYFESLLQRVSFCTDNLVNEEFVDSVLASNKVVDFEYRHPSSDFHLWGNFLTGLFILEDNLSEGLQGTILVRQLNDEKAVWSSWIVGI